VSVLLNNGAGTFAGKVDYPTDLSPILLATADFNGDGNPDLASVNNIGSVSVLLNNGNGTFAAKVDYPAGTNPLAIATGDFNGDGKPDLAVAKQWSERIDEQW